MKTTTIQQLKSHYVSMCNEYETILNADEFQKLLYQRDIACVSFLTASFIVDGLKMSQRVEDKEIALA